MSSAVSLAVLGGSLACDHSSTQTLSHSCTFPLAQCLVFTVFQFRKGKMRWKLLRLVVESWFIFKSTSAKFGDLTLVSPQLPDMEFIWLHVSWLAIFGYANIHMVATSNLMLNQTVAGMPGEVLQQGSNDWIISHLASRQKEIDLFLSEFFINNFKHSPVQGSNLWGFPAQNFLCMIINLIPVALN